MSPTIDRELLITREFLAPRELVWEAWTDPRHLIHWWGPDGFTYTIHEMNLKPGGMWRYIMHGPDNVEFTNRILYTEVDKPKYLAYEHSSDIDNDPEKFFVTVRFESKAKTTEVTIRMVFPTAEQLKEVIEKYGALEVQRKSMLKLDEYLKKM